MSARLTLYHSLKIILKLFAPFLPHITEELYQLLYTTDDSIHRRGSWPVLDLVFNGVDKSSEQLIEVLEMVRKVKAKDNLSIKAPINYIEIAGKKSLSDDLITDLQNVTSTMEIRFVSELSSKEQELKTEVIEINVVYSK